MKKSVILTVAGGVLVIGAAAAAYLKRKAVKQAIPEIIDQIKKRLPKTQPDDAPDPDPTPDVEE